MNYREKIRKAIECPQFGDERYGEWGALKLEQRVLIRRLLNELDSADNFVEKLFEEKEKLKKQLNELQKPQIFIDTQDMEERYGEELYQDYLEEQVKDLKKQLEDTIEELECVRCDLHNRTSERDSAEKQNDLYKTQQQEFISYLEKEIVDCKAGSGQQYYAQEHLKMFKEIIGNDINARSKEGNKDEIN